MKKYAIINQVKGIGDIFYLQKAVKYISKNVDEVIWYVHSNYYYIKDYIKYGNIKYLRLPLVGEEFHDEEKKWYNHFYTPHIHGLGYDGNIVKVFSKELDAFLYYFPFANSVGLNITPKFVMNAKYKMIKMSDQNWQKYFTYIRNEERENDLRIKYGVELNEEFIFVNSLMKSFDYDEVKINIDSNIKVIKNDGSPCHLFDFCWLLENAKEIHTVETSLCYLVETLNTTDNLFCYSRNNVYGNFDYIKDVYKKNWKYIL